jgi:UDPglucose 6-dehydrogenase
LWPVFCYRKDRTVAKIAVIGTGYVGLCTAVTFAHLGNTVVGLDIDTAKVARLTAGACPIFEPGLATLLTEQTAARRLAFTTAYDEAIPDADFVFICVNTPPAADGGADMRFVRAAASAIGASLSPGHCTIIVDKSTMPVGSGDMVHAVLGEHAPAGARFAVVSNPEFLREGAAVHDMLHPDRVVLGSHDRAAAEAVAALYTSFDTAVLVTDLRTAEMIKYASNAFLATRISFMNEVAQICESVGADVRGVAAGMGMDKRIGPHFLNAGIGFGGSCFPKDVMALAHMAEEGGCSSPLLHAALEINRDARRRFVRKIEESLGTLAGATIAVWGLAFKPDTDDLREAPSLEIIPALQSLGATVRAYDPVAMEAARPLLRGVTLCADPYEAARGADAVALITDWTEFTGLDLARVARTLRRPIIVDGRNVYDPDAAAALGFAYHGMGVRSAAPVAVTINDTPDHPVRLPVVASSSHALAFAAAD